MSMLFFTDADRSKKNGFDEYIQSDPCKFDHHDLFKMLQTATLDFRLNDPYCSLVNISIIIYFNVINFYLLGLAKSRTELCT